MYELEIFCNETLPELLDNTVETADEVCRLYQLSQHSGNNERDYYEAAMQSMWLETHNDHFRWELGLG